MLRKEKIPVSVEHLLRARLTHALTTGGIPSLLPPCQKLGEALSL